MESAKHLIPNIGEVLFEESLCTPQRYIIALRTCSPECIVKPERKHELKLAVEVNFVHYKDVHDRQT